MQTSPVQRVARLQERDVFDPRPSAPRHGGTDVAMDDHGVRRIPADWRWSYLGATFTTFGVTTAMIFPLSGALYAQAFGAPAAIIGAAVTALCTIAAVYYAVRHAMNEGISADLLSRSSFGYVGSAFNTLVYGAICAFYFAVEGSVMAHALHEALPALSYTVWAVLTSASFVLLGIFGMVLLTKVQWGTLVLYFFGLAVAFWALVRGWDERVTLAAMAGWWRLDPSGAGELDAWSALEAIGAYLGTLGVGNAIFMMDVARFMRREDLRVGSTVFVLVNTVLPVFGMYVVGITMYAASGQPDPGVTLVRLIGPLGLVVTLVTQLRINLINVYSGTLCLANFSSRVLGFVPGRQFWVIPFLALSTAVIVSPFREHFEHLTTYISVFLCACVGSLIGERVVVRRRYALPAWSEVRRAYLPDFNPVGLLAMWVPTAVAMVMATGVFGRQARALAAPVALLTPPLVAGVVAAALRPEQLLRAYVGRDIVVPPADAEMLTCTVCRKSFHRSDFAHCPFHGGEWICSYCCMGERRCDTLCRRDDRGELAVPVLEPAGSGPAPR